MFGAYIAVPPGWNTPDGSRCPMFNTGVKPVASIDASWSVIALSFSWTTARMMSLMRPTVGLLVEQEAHDLQRCRSAESVREVRQGQRRRRRVLIADAFREVERISHRIRRRREGRGDTL